MQHARTLAAAYSDATGYVELLLAKQLIGAIGKEVTSADFDAYLHYHWRKRFQPQYAPRLFAYGVRRPEHDPEGIVSIRTEGRPLEHIETFVNGGPAKWPMKSGSPYHSIPADSCVRFALDAATNVSFMGDRYVHGWLTHQFDGPQVPLSSSPLPPSHLTSFSAEP